MSQKYIYHDENVAISTNQVTVGATTYPIRNIVSVQASYTKPNLGCAIALIVVFGFFSLTSIFTFFNPDHSFLTALIQQIVMVTLLMIGIRWYRRKKVTYHVVITTSAGSNQALSSYNEQYIDEVANAIRTAVTS